MPLRTLRVYDSNNKIKPYTEYSLCQKHADCYDYGFPKSHGGGCYFERLSVRRKRSKKPKRRNETVEDKNEDEILLEEKGDDEDDGLDLMADSEKATILLVKVCRMEQDFKFTSASNRCLRDDDCPPGFYCHDINFKCTFIGNYGDRCGAAVIQEEGIHKIEKEHSQKKNMKQEKEPGFTAEPDESDGEGDEGKGTPKKKVIKNAPNEEDSISEKIAPTAHDIDAVQKAKNDPCPKGLYCHGEIHRCLSLAHKVTRDSGTGKILCRKYADCPPTHYCSMELEVDKNPLDQGLCIAKLNEGQGCNDHRQCRFGLGCIEDIGSFRISRCHRRCYTNYDCYPKGVCTSGNSTMSTLHLPNIRFCFGDRPVLYPDATEFRQKRAEDASTDTLLILAGIIISILGFFLVSFLALFYYKRAKARR